MGHKNKIADGFTLKYNIDKLIYFEIFEDPQEAIKREKRLKFWLRKWKEDLINKHNPQWNDMYEDICA